MPLLLSEDLASRRSKDVLLVCLNDFRTPLTARDGHGSSGSADNWLDAVSQGAGSTHDSEPSRLEPRLTASQIGPQFPYKAKKQQTKHSLE